MVVERRGFFAQGRVAQEGYLADVQDSVERLLGSGEGCPW